MAREVQNPALSAFKPSVRPRARYGLGDPQTALMPIEDSLALTRAGAFDPILGTALTWATSSGPRTGDLPGALDMLQEAMVQQHADGNRLLLGMTLQIAAVVLARSAKPNRPWCCPEPSRRISSTLGVHEDEKMGIGEAQSLAHRTLGEAGYAALARGAAMDDDEFAGYAQGEFRRLAALRAQPGAQAPESRWARRGRAAPE